MENIGEYAALVAQSTAINQNEFEEKAQEEQAEVEKQQSKNSAIEGVIAPFGVEAIKGAGGKNTRCKRPSETFQRRPTSSNRGIISKISTIGSR